VIGVDDDLRRMIHQGASEQEMEAYVRIFTPSLKYDGVQAVLAGVTSLEELLRVTTAG
jgi:general secretion pathway protein E